MYAVRHRSSYYKADFPTYEKARQFVRKQLRKKFDSKDARTDLYRILTQGYWDSTSRNPSCITNTGYYITKPSVPF